jgi:EAL and modified HD-GYP domain-containing signal transduction protein
LTFFAARQPILNVDKSLFAYELLFRDGMRNAFPDVDDEQATSKMVAGLQFNLGLDSLTEGELAFINFTHDSLLNGFPKMLPSDQIVVEILETVRPDKKMLRACIELKEKGYMLALDDYEHQAVWTNFFPYIDIIKLDYQLTSPDKFTQIVAAIKPFPHIKLLAEKIETYKEYQHALQLGCVYFQGYFFSKPEVIQSASFSPSQFSLMSLMAEMYMPEPDIKIIIRAFESDVNLAFKLLRYAQSPIFKRRVAIESIKQAVVVLGKTELERFMSLLFTAQFSANKPGELTKMSLGRARCCEVLADIYSVKLLQPAAFLVGLLSLLDAMVDTEMEQLMAKLPISQDIKDAILQRSGDYGNLLILCEYFETAQWENASRLCNTLQIDPDTAIETYQQSLIWARERTETIE